MVELDELLADLEAKGWSQAALARELGVHWNTIWRWRNGLQSPANSVSVVRQLRELLARKRVPRQGKAKGSRNVTAHNKAMNVEREGP